MHKGFAVRTSPHEVLDELIAELREMLERVGGELRRCADGGDKLAAVKAIYRDVHTVKGNAQMFGLRRLQVLAHAVEEVLEPVRRNEHLLDPALTKLLFSGFDLMAQMADALHTTRSEAPVEAALQALANQLRAQTEANAAHGTKPPEVPSLPPAGAEAPGSSTAQPQADSKAKPEAATDSIRVPVAILDNLMNLVGELLLIRNQLQEEARHTEDQAAQNLCQRLNLITSELQSEVMKTRMQPVGNLLNKFHRVVRDLAKDLGKEVELKVEGSETELDKTLLEAVKDPLMHIVRNCVDHGLEASALRRQLGKSAAGKILVRAQHESGYVIIATSDDGRGLDLQRIGAKAVEKGLRTAAQVAQMSERDLAQLIFLPGFSTADKVSSVSGRGVGMDVVKTNIERLGGKVEISSVFGSGTTIALKIPLTLAILPALLVRAGTQRFALPQMRLEELIRLEVEPGQAPKLRQLQGQDVYERRGQLLPVVSLEHSLFTAGAPKGGAMNKTLVILRSDDLTFGLIVDAIEDSVDLVVKALPAFVQDIGVYSGATVLGDGSIALVIDVAGLAARAHVAASGERGQRSVPVPVLNPHGESTEYLLVDLGLPGRYALPLCMVHRLEEFSAEAVIVASDKRVINYRGLILPLVDVALTLGLAGAAPSPPPGGSLTVVVIKEQERFVGLQVRAILDTFVSKASLDEGLQARAGFLGGLVDEQDITVILDVDGLVARWRGRPQRSVLDKQQRAKHLLLVAEDSQFFRRQMLRSLESVGFRVIAVADGEEAWSTLQTPAGAGVALLISDIEMPALDGHGLVRRLRADQRLQALPAIAVTSRFEASEIERGKASGFTLYLEKFNSERLVAEIDQLLGIDGAAPSAADATGS